MSESFLSQQVQPRKALQRMKPYSPGKPIWEVQRELGIEKVIKLASNENPLGPSPKAVEAIQACLADIHRYPDADAADLRQAIAGKLNVTSEQVIVTNGGDELITLVSETFLEPDDEIVIPSPTFSEYEFGADLMNTRVVSVPLRENYQYDVDDILAAVSERTKIVYICSPNNPTGTYIAQKDLKRLLDALPERVLTVFDGAYSDFVDADDYTDGLEFVSKGYSLVILRTFSKIYGLAGIRVGYGIASPAIIRTIRQVKEPFNVNALAQAGAIGAVADQAHLEATREANARGREQLYDGLQRLGVHFTRSMSNFVWVQLGPEAKTIYDKLMARGIIVRYGGAWGFSEHVRISVGTSDDNAALLDSLAAVLKEV